VGTDTAGRNRPGDLHDPLPRRRQGPAEQRRGRLHRRRRRRPGAAGSRQAPLAVTGTAVVLAGTDTLTHQPLNGLHVDAATLAALYTGRPATAATRLQTLNPTVHPPARLIGLTVPADDAQTRRLTRWLQVASPTTWRAGTQDQLPHPAPAGVQPVADDTTLIRLLTSPPATGTGYLAYLDITGAAAARLPTAALAGPGGQFARPTPAALAASATAGTTAPAGSYPLTVLDTITIPAAPTPAAARTLAALLTYAAGPGQNHLPAGLPPLPGPLAARTAALAAGLAPPTPTPVPPAPGPVSRPTHPAPGTARPEPEAEPAAVPAPARPGPGRSQPAPQGPLAGRPLPGSDTPAAHTSLPRPGRARKSPSTPGQWMPASMAPPVADQLTPAAPAKTTTTTSALSAVEPPQLAPLATATSTPPAPGTLTLAGKSLPTHRHPVVTAALGGLLLLAFAAAAAPGRSPTRPPTQS